MIDLRPSYHLFWRQSVAGLVSAALLLIAPQPVEAQVETVFGIGYCIDDIDDNEVMDFSELGAAFSTSTIAAPSSVGASFDANVDLYSITRHFNPADGSVDPTTISLVGSPRSRLLDTPFDGVAGIDSAASGAGELTLIGGNHYIYNIDGRCVTGSTRTDTDTSDDTVVTHTTTGNNGVDISSRDTSGFSFEGNIVLTFTGDVDGDIAFSDSGTQDSDITLSIQEGSFIYGNLVLGEDGGSGVATADVVASNAGVMRRVILDDSSNVQFTNTGTISQADGILARGVDVGLSITNDVGGSISNINAGGTERLVITNANGAAIGGIILGDVVTDGAGGITADTGNAFTDVSTTITNNGQIQQIIADRDGQFSLTNSGTGRIVSQLDDALLLSGSATLNLDNQGRIEAASSDAISFTDYSGNFTLTNTGTIQSSTNDAISGDETTGSFNITNRGTITSTNNRAISLNDVNTANDEDIVVVNGTAAGAGTITSNQDAIAISDTATSGADDMSVAITNGTNSSITANFGNAIESQNVDSLTITNGGSISAGVDPAVLADGSDSLTINNGGANATITATSMTALSAASVSGDIDIDNAGTIRAFNRTINLTDAEGEMDINNSGTISATHTLGDAASSNYDNYTIYASRVASGSGGDVTVLNSSSSTISINSDNAIVLRNFNRTDDAIAFTNNGTISAGRSTAIDFNNSQSVTLTTGSDAVISAAEEVAISVADVRTAFSLTNAGSITASASAVHGSLTAGADVTVSNSGTISTIGGDTVRLENIAAPVTFGNSGTIRAGDEDEDDGTDSQDAVYLADIGANAVIFTNSASGVISATGDRAVYIEAASTVSFSNLGTANITADIDPVVFDVPTGGAAKLTFNNEGTISLTDDAAASLIDVTNFGKPLSITNSGTLSTPGARAITGALDGTGGTVTINNNGGIIAADEGETIHLSDIDAAVTFTNSGSIAAGNASHDSKNDAVFLDGIGNHAVVFTNAASGAISATGNRAVYLNASSAISFSNEAGAEIAADDTVIEFDVSASPTMTFTNAGTIRATSSAASHLLNFDDFTGTLDITNSGTISTAGSSAITASMAAGTHALDFENTGTISTTGAIGVVLGSFDGTVNVVNGAGGTLSTGSSSTAAAHNLRVTGGSRVTFSNAGTMTASGNSGVNVMFDGLGATAGNNVHSFTNSGTIIGGARALIVSGSSAASYSLTNSGTIRATGTGLAVDMSGVTATVNSSGSIVTNGSRAMQVGGGSTLSIGGPLQALGSSPIALALEGTASQITLNDGARLLGDFLAIDTGAITGDADKHTVTLSAVENASYYYDFDDRYFRFLIDGVETAQASGFSAGTSNYATSLIMHTQHGDAQRRLFHDLGSTDRNQPLKTMVYANSIDDEQGTRGFGLDVDRSGYAQSLQGSVFDWFDAEIVLSRQTASYAVDTNIHKLDSTYTGAGLGFSDLLSLGPFSISALAMAGIGEVDTKRRVYTNTNTQGFIDVSSSYETTHLDAVAEALFNMRIFGARKKLSRRNPYRINLEVALGSSLHSEERESYSESSYITTKDHSLTSISNMVRLRGEFLSRSQFNKQPYFIYAELRHAISMLTDGETFTYTLAGNDLTHEQEMDDVATSSFAIGGQYRLDDDLAIDLSVNYVDSDNDFSTISGSASVTWRF